MTLAAARLAAAVEPWPGVRPARRFLPRPTEEPLALATLQGRLTELRVGQGAHTRALRLVWQAQRVGEPAIWVQPASRGFFPPDAQASGVDLAALPVVRLEEPLARLRAVDLLLRAGAFGLVVLDWGAGPPPSERGSNRLVGLAQAHGVALLCLVGEAFGGRTEGETWGAPVSLRLEATCAREAPGRYRCGVRALKDRRFGPGWTREEACDGPDGLC